MYITKIDNIKFYKQVFENCRLCWIYYWNDFGYILNERKEFWWLKIKLICLIIVLLALSIDGTQGDENREKIPKEFLEDIEKVGKSNVQSCSVRNLEFSFISIKPVSKLQDDEIKQSTMQWLNEFVSELIKDNCIYFEITLKLKEIYSD